MGVRGGLISGQSSQRWEDTLQVIRSQDYGLYVFISIVIVLEGFEIH